MGRMRGVSVCRGSEELFSGEPYDVKESLVVGRHVDCALDFVLEFLSVRSIWEAIIRSIESGGPRSRPVWRGERGWMIQSRD